MYVSFTCMYVCLCACICVIDSVRKIRPRKCVNRRWRVWGMTVIKMGNEKKNEKKNVRSSACSSDTRERWTPDDERRISGDQRSMIFRCYISFSTDVCTVRTARRSLTLLHTRKLKRTRDDRWWKACIEHFVVMICNIEQFLRLIKQQTLQWTAHIEPILQGKKQNNHGIFF